MRVFTVIRLFAAVIVLSGLACTLVLAQRFFGEAGDQKPAKTKLEQLIPATQVGEEELEELKEKLEVENLPDVTPGERAFEAARNLLTLGDFAAAEEKLKYVTTYYPTAPSASEARRIIGEMNMDRLLSGKGFVEQRTYKVKRGDSFFKIASDHRTNLELIKLLNGLDDLNRLHPGDELIVMPLDLRIVIDVRQQLIKLWADGKFIKGYETKVFDLPKGSGVTRTKIQAVEANVKGKRISSIKDLYRESEKVIVVNSPQFEIRAEGDFSKDGFIGAILDKPDIEELALLLRKGNSVEIRY